MMLPIAHNLAKRGFFGWTQMPVDGVAAHGYGQLHIVQMSEQLLPPLWRTLRTGRQVTTFATPWVTKAHGHQGNLFSVIEGF